MTAVTVVKTVGTTGTFSTPQLWEDGAPADLTTAEKSAATTFLVAAFTQGESLTFVGSGATGKLLDTDSTGAGSGTYVTYGITTGNPAASDVVTGGTSGATCVLTSGTATNVGVIWQGQGQNQEFSSLSQILRMTGSTCSSSAFKEFTTVAGASFRDNANKQTNALQYNSANGCAVKTTSGFSPTVQLSDTAARVSNIQIQATGSNGGACSSGDSSTRMDFCICESTNDLHDGVVQFRASGQVITNSVFIQRKTGADQIVDADTGSPSYYNCTFVAPDDLATAPTACISSVSGGTITVQNCGLFAGDSAKAVKSGTSTFTFTTCYSDISGTAGVTQCTYSSEFQNVNDATRDYRLKAGAAELDTGTTDTTHAATDIVGTSRPQGSAYDVGCWELITATTNLFAQSCM